MGELTNSWTLWLGGVLIMSLLVQVVLLKLVRNGYEMVERWYMPGELARGRLVMADQILRTARGKPMEARIADLFQRRDGALVLVESRSRGLPRVYPSDVAHLSAVAYVLRHCDHPLITTAPVATHAWVRVLNGQSAHPRYLKVALLDASAVEALADRAELLLREPAEARATMTRALCKDCRMKSRCPHQGGPQIHRNSQETGGGFTPGTPPNANYSDHHTNQGTGTLQ
jgi:hypothetical protein